MNENIDLTKILKDCPRGWKLYSIIYGEVQFRYIGHGDYPIEVELTDSSHEGFTEDGRIYSRYDGECVLLPSKNQRDWSKFTAPWYKKGKFDHKTLKQFDRVIVRNFKTTKWRCEHFSYFDGSNYNPCIASCCSYAFCIPYNDDTMHHAGTRNEAPEYYKYWED